MSLKFKGKTACCIEMLQLLSDGRIWKISEIAEHLSNDPDYEPINPRNIIEYRKELDKIATDNGYEFMIETIHGKYGGYKLNGNIILPSIRLNSEEKETVLEAYSYLRAREDFPKPEIYEKAMSRIFASIDTSGEQIIDESLVLQHMKIAMPEKELNERYILLEKAMRHHNVVNMDYLSNDNVYYNRNVHPYKLFMYRDAWFVLCYCEYRKQMMYFKINRINKLTLLDRKFSKDYFYKEQEYFDKFGMTKSIDTQDYHVKLQFFGVAAMYVKDYIYGKNQITTDNPDGTTTIEVDMRYKNNIVSFVLSHRGNCKVVEPEWLKEEVKKAALATLENLK